MKKLLVLLATITLIFGLTACGNEDITYTLESDDIEYDAYLSDDNPVIAIEIESHGTIYLQLFKDLAPNTVDNMIRYIQNGDYDNNEFHRVIEGFMIQGGKLDSPSCTILGEMDNNPRYTGSNALKHYRGVLSMARVGGNYDSQSSQFFIMHEDYFGLDKEYAAFGGIVAGFDVLDSVAVVLTTGYPTDAPIHTITIKSIELDLNGYEPQDPVCE